ncbi:MAG: helix-turn-helix domain-containing protein [Bauldia sp.]|nr:helix-turn-helix domain-containing protein [Bauldia sp.]
MANKAPRTVGESIVAGLKEAIAFLNGEDVPGLVVHIPADMDVKAIRGRLGLSQAQFAKKYGFSVGRVRDWEQGRTMPDTATRNFLRVIAADPEAVDRALSAA